MDFTDSEIRALQRHPAVRSVSRKEVLFTYEFKLWFCQEDRKGIPAADIFESADIDPDILGHHRIHSFRGHLRMWQKAHPDWDTYQQQLNDVKARIRRMRSLSNKYQLVYDVISAGKLGIRAAELCALVSVRHNGYCEWKRLRGKR